MIPKIIHQIWIGESSKMPLNDIKTWKENHPEWKHILWTEKEIDDFNLINRDKYDKYYNDKCYNGCANVARIEIINKLGGIYVDADSISTNPMDELLTLEFFAVYSPNIEGRVGNAFFGSGPNNYILKEYIDEVGKLKKLHPSYKTSGGTTFGKILNKHNMMDKVLPAHSFYLINRFNRKTEPVCKNYATHYWGTTFKSY